SKLIRTFINSNLFGRNRCGRATLLAPESSPEREHTSIQAPIFLHGISDAVHILLRVSNPAAPIDAVDTTEL
ncbi:MAG: hypothetical protein KDA72_12840, partial [Planctomycetales bacterium]|nr:hypothetical protein [Planctomycetales bacterium]